RFSAQARHSAFRHAGVAGLPPPAALKRLDLISGPITPAIFKPAWPAAALMFLETSFHLANA
ncbi:MAG: hypothetical protein QME74_10485, partial [Candidatus Edwardsbacteria bacterium]|nr:hypothetical protein [Candidatus Edwardsbacteria bacterium]